MLLVGRSQERDRIERLLEGARRGRSGVLVLRGEAGIGKTALLRYALDLGEAMTVARAAGVESEAELEFSGLLDVCRPLLSWLDVLPPHQGNALRRALGLTEGRTTERFAVGAALLGLLAAAAEAQPLLVVVDDAHWLDEASADALRFAARRLVADRVAVLFAVRSSDGRGVFESDGFDELELRGLTAHDARRLLGHVAQASLPDDVVDRLCEATGGNPLALVELPELLEPEQLAGTKPVQEPLPAGAGVERAFARRLDRLDDDCRRALVVLAAASTRELAPALGALQRLGLDAAVLEPAEEAGLLELDGIRFAFRHPLLRAVVYSAASEPDRRRANRALADALVRPGDEERRAWHLAAAAVGPDAEAADALAAAADRARGRSGFGAASAGFERSARLSTDDSLRLERLASAAESAWAGGAPDRAVNLLDEALVQATEPRVRARLLQLRGRFEQQAGVVADARARFREAAALIEELDRVAAAAALNYAVFSCHFEGRLTEALELARHARALVPNDGSAADRRADYVLGRSLLLLGQVNAGTALLERVIAAAVEHEHPPRASLTPAAISLSMLDRHRECRALVEPVLALARAEGPMALTYSLSLSAETELRAGSLQRATASATEGLSLARELGQPNIVAAFLGVLARVDAVQGREEAFRTRSGEALERLEAAGMALPAATLLCARGLLELGSGRLDEAVETLGDATSRSAEMRIADSDVLPEPDLIETLVRLGHRDDARAAFDAWAGRESLRESRPARALMSRCRGLLDDDDTFTPAFADALEGHAAAEDAFGEARTRLCFGERLRRKGLRVEARRELRQALETFEAVQAARWVERARSELRASGERLRRREEIGDELTPQELQVALQVAEGKTNKEVASALFLSPKTVEFHLGRIFRKLAVSSRAELAKRVLTEGVVGAPA